MARISRARILVERGFFPSQLPPAFHTGDLAAHTADLIAAWTPPRGTAPKRAKWELFSVARAGHHRRATALVNPIPEVLLCGHLERFWGKLVRHYRGSALSASHPRFIASGRRGASIPPMRPLYERRTLISAGYKFVLQTDISRFFPTIYTHSIPWALHGKALAKRKRDKSARYFGNILDGAIQDCQDGQTLGIPIGPDSSHIISEAVITAVDVLFRKKVGVKPVGLRYVDDIYLFFPTYAEAESALGHLARVLREFELQVNFDKTSIRPIWEVTEDSWTHELQGAQLSLDIREQRSDINRYFERIKRLARENKDENVAVYALKRAARVLIRPDNWPLFESHMCHLAMANPNALDYVARVLSTYKRLGFPINAERIGRLCNQLVRDHGPLSHDSEVAWALWICKDLGLPIAADGVRIVSAMHSSICALLLLHLEQLGKTAIPVDYTYWRQFNSVASLWEDLWLLSYEAGVRGWAGFNDAHIAADTFFNELRTRGVRFYDDGRELAPIFRLEHEPQGPQGSDGRPLVDAEFFNEEDAGDYLVFEDDEGVYGEPVVFDSGQEDVNEPDDLPF